MLVTHCCKAMQKNNCEYKYPKNLFIFKHLFLYITACLVSMYFHIISFKLPYVMQMDVKVDPYVLKSPLIEDENENHVEKDKRQELIQQEILIL